MKYGKNKFPKVRTKRKSILPKLIFFIVAAFMYSSMFDNSQQKPNTPQQAGNPTQSGGGTAGTGSNRIYSQGGEIAAASSLYALQPLKDSWPLSSRDEDETISIQSDLLTKNYYIVLDGSGSMKKTECSDGRQKMEVAIEALQTFATTLPSSSNFGLAVFRNDSIKEIIPLQKARSNIKINSFEPSGSTPLKSSIGFAYQRITNQAKKQLGYGEYHLVVITDGKASEGQNPGNIVNAMLQESPVILETIGFCIGIHHILNQPGRSAYKAANNSAELRKGLKDVMAESPDFRIDAF